MSIPKIRLSSFVEPILYFLTGCVILFALMYSLREMAISHLSASGHHLGLVITTEDVANSSEKADEESPDSETAVALEKQQARATYANTPCTPQEPHWRCDFAGKIAL